MASVEFLKILTYSCTFYKFFLVVSVFESNLIRDFSFVYYFFNQNLMNAQTVAQWNSTWIGLVTRLFAGSNPSLTVRLDQECKKYN